MDVKEFVTHKDPDDKYGGLITFGERNINIPDDALISITLGEQFSVWKTIVNGIVGQFVMKQMKKSKGLLYAEMKGHIKDGYGLTLTVWENKAMVPFRNRGSHKFAMKFFSWVFYSGKSHAYFLTYKANGEIPTAEEAHELVKRYGKFYDGGKLIRTAKSPLQKVAED